MVITCFLRPRICIKSYSITVKAVDTAESVNSPEIKSFVPLSIRNALAGRSHTAAAPRAAC